jgi:hypothetical protein
LWPRRAELSRCFEIGERSATKDTAPRPAARRVAASLALDFAALRSPYPPDTAHLRASRPAPNLLATPLPCVLQQALRGVAVCTLWIGCGLFAASPGWAAQSDQAQKDREAEEEAREDQQKAATPRDSFMSESAFKGRIAIFDEPESQDTPGTFTVGAKVYLLKVRNDDLKAKIRALNRKEVVLAGKVRNQGKYFVVESIPEPPPPPPRMADKHGL